jgi:hypothetical protein
MKLKKQQKEKQTMAKNKDKNILGVNEETRKLQNVDIAIIDEETRTVRFSASSEFPVERYDWRDGSKYMEILSHDPADVDLERMRAGGPLLDKHYGDQLEVVEKIEIKDKRLMIEARFSKNARPTEIFNDIVDKIRTNVSIGYNKTGIVSSKAEKGKLKEVRFAWYPFEVSMEPVPADPTVGIGRDLAAGKRELSLGETPQTAPESQPIKMIITC